MNDPPLYSRELKLIRGTVSVVGMSRKLNKSREFVRLVESGKLVPSYDTLETWLAVTGTEAIERKDILRSMLQEKATQCKVVEDLEKIRSIAFENCGSSSTELVEELVDVLMEVGDLKDSMRDGQLMRVRKIFEKHREWK